MKTWKTKTVDGAKGIVLREIDRELNELPATAYGAEVEHDKDGNPVKVELAEERFIAFAAPGGRVAAKRLYTVKAEKADGTLIQVPMEDQINNHVASPENAVGLRAYDRRGVNMFYDYETGRGAFCPTWDCWAEWSDEFDGCCSEAHKEITYGNQSEGAFGTGATTSRGWG